MITYNKIVPQTVEVWNDEGFFAEVNEYELNDLRIQIKNEEDGRFYIMFNDEPIAINKYGQVEYFPIGMFDTLEDQLDILTQF